MSCKAILGAGLSSGDGVYWIDPNGGDHADAFEAYCDMTTDGGGWTLAVNSVVGEEPSTNDMTSNTGVPGLDRGHTRDLTNLAINNSAEIRYFLDNSSRNHVFHAKFTGRYHDALPVFSNWTTLAGHLVGSDILLADHFGRRWSTWLADHDVFFTGSCAGLPWHYGNCWSAIPADASNGLTQGPADGRFFIMRRFSIFVREVAPITIPPPNVAPSFRAAINLPVGRDPLDTAVGDFDDDARPDILTVNAVDFTLRYGNGTVLKQFAHTGARSVATGHFNTDDRLDFVVGYRSPGAFAAFINQGGDFALTQQFPACPVSDLATADFDQNGTTDVAIACDAGPLLIAAATGDGSFSIVNSLTTQTNTANLAVADFNGDSRSDIVVTGGTTGCVNVLLSSGGFGFSSHPQCFATFGESLGRVVVGDVTGDGRPDFAVSTGSYVDTFENTDGMRFSRVGRIAPSGLVWSVTDLALDDVNADRRPDLIIAQGSPTMQVSLNLGGLFSTPVPFNTSSLGWSVAAADLDSDGMTDIVVVDGMTDSVSVLYNSFSFTNRAPTASDGTLTVTEGTTETGTLSATDPDDAALTFTLTSTGAKGTATITNPWMGTFSYSANPGQSGTDTFTFTVSDGVHTSSAATITVTITPRHTPRITWATPAAIVYGTPLGAAQLNASVEPGVTGTFTYAPAAGVVLRAGAAQTVSFTFMPDDTAHYTPASGTVPIDVLPAPLTARTNAAAIVFGQAPPPFTATFAGFVNGDTPASLGGSLTFTGPSSTDAGSYPIMPGGLTSSNYAIDFQPGTLTINQAPTTTALSASSTTVAALQPFTLTATLRAGAPGAGVPTGTVTFFDGAMRVGTAAGSGGVATLTMTGHVPGAHAFTARYDGGGNFAASTSAPAGVTVRDLAQSTLTFASPLNGQTFFGQRVTLGAVVTALAGGVTPTGSVAFLDGGTLLGTAPLSGGVAHLSTNALPVGARFIFAVYLGNATWAPSVSTPAAYNVFTGTTPLTGPMTLTSLVAPTPLGDPMTFHVAILPPPGNATPTGTVVFLADNTLLGTAPISKFDGLARAELTTSALSAGIHLVSAIYVGDGVFGAIAAGPILREVR